MARFLLAVYGEPGQEDVPVETREDTRMTVHQVTTSIIVGREAGDVYRSWSDLERLPELMPHLRDAAARDWTRRALEQDLRSFKAHLEGRG
jgi:uncharacterized membrane protein